MLRWDAWIWLGFALTGALVGGCSNGIAEPPGASQAAPAVQNVAASFTERLAPHLSRSGKGLVVRDGLRGGHSLALDGRYHGAQVARLRPDGSLAIECVTSLEELRARIGKAGRP